MIEGWLNHQGSGLLDNWMGDAFHCPRNEGVGREPRARLLQNGPDAILENRKDILLTLAAWKEQRKPVNRDTDSFGNKGRQAT